MSSVHQKASAADYFSRARAIWIKPKFARIEAGEPSAADSDGTIAL